MTIDITKWDRRFMRLAREVAHWSKDPSTKVGAVLVSADRRQVIIGYNGFPAGIKDDPELLGNREEKYKRVVHAEVNAILNASRDLRGYTLYTWPLPPCERCAVLVIQSGIVRVVGQKPEGALAARWDDKHMLARDLFGDAGVVFRLWDLDLKAVPGDEVDFLDIEPNAVLPRPAPPRPRCTCDFHGADPECPSHGRRSW